MIVKEQRYLNRQEDQSSDVPAALRDHHELAKSPSIHHTLGCSPLFSRREVMSKCVTNHVSSADPHHPHTQVNCLKCINDACQYLLAILTRSRRFEIHGNSVYRRYRL
jgi:hypothetical protein